MTAYQLPFELCLPLLSVCKVLNRDVGFYCSLNSRCDLKKGCHFCGTGVVNLEMFGSGRWCVEVKEVLAEF